jgi:hypothetical protein
MIRLDAMKPCTGGWASADERSWGKNDGETKSFVDMSNEAALSLFKMSGRIFYYDRVWSYLNCDCIDECSSPQFYYFDNKFKTALVMPIPESIVSRAMLVPCFWKNITRARQ